MDRRDISLTLSLCASLVVHALLLATVAQVVSGQLGTHLSGPLVAYLPNVPPPFFDQDDPARRLGDSEGTGDATDASPGDEPMQTIKTASQAQAFLSLDPIGLGDIGDEPTESVLPKGPPGAPAQEEIAALSQQMQQEQSPFGLSNSTSELTPPPVAPRPPTPATPPGAAASADPAPQGSTESDPVATVGSANFRPGSTDVRLGRQHKIIRPRLSLAARADLMTLRNPTVVLKINTDETGKVTAVQVYRSSGSNDIDQPCKLAAYQWWFEPPKDRVGNPTKDVILFAIHFI